MGAQGRVYSRRVVGSYGCSGKTNTVGFPRRSLLSAVDRRVAKGNGVELNMPLVVDR